MAYGSGTYGGAAYGGGTYDNASAVIQASGTVSATGTVTGAPVVVQPIMSLYAGRYGSEAILTPAGGLMPPNTPVYVYAPGTSTQLALFTDRTATVAAPNPVPVDANSDLSFFVKPAPAYVDIVANGVRKTLWVPADPAEPSTGGPTGPQGPQGPVGAQGGQGVPGPQGPTGAPGSDNAFAGPQPVVFTTDPTKPTSNGIEFRDSGTGRTSGGTISSWFDHGGAPSVQIMPGQVVISVTPGGPRRFLVLTDTVAAPIAWFNSYGGLEVNDNIATSWGGGGSPGPPGGFYADIYGNLGYGQRQIMHYAGLGPPGNILDYIDATFEVYQGGRNGSVGSWTATANAVAPVYTTSDGATSGPGAVGWYSGGGTNKVHQQGSYDGYYAMQMQSVAAGRCRYESKNYPVPPGTTATAVGFFLSAQLNAVNSYVALRWKDASGNLLRADSSASLYTGNGGWGSTQGGPGVNGAPGTPPAGATQASVEASFDAAGAGALVDFDCAAIFLRSGIEVNRQWSAPHVANNYLGTGTQSGDRYERSGTPGSPSQVSYICLTGGTPSQQAWASTTPRETYQAITASTAATTIAVANGQVVDVAMTASTTFNFAPIDAVVGTPFSFTLRCTQDATGGRTATWPGGTKWANSAPGVLSNAPGRLDIFDVLTVWGVDTSWLMFLAGPAMG